MVNLLQILSGIALILFGVRCLREGLDRIFGIRLNNSIEHLANRPVHAFVAGLGVGMAVPSSTSISVLLTQAFQTARLKAKQGLPLLLGADVGVTALVLLTSLHLEKAAPIQLILGVILLQFTHDTRPRGIGQILLGLAFVLMAVTTISNAGAVVASNRDAVSLLEIAEHYPAALAILSGALAVALQSSTATIVLVASFGAAGAMSLPLTLCVVLGANLGIAVTRLVIAWNVIEARRLMIVGLTTRILVLCIFVFFSQPIVDLLARAPLGYRMDVAMMHIGFNVIGAAIGWILGPLMVAAVNHLVIAPEALNEHVFGPRYINLGAVDSPSLALGQSLREIVRAAEIVREMFNDLWRAMENSDERLARAVSRRDDQVDLLDKEVKRFLTHVAEFQLDPENTDEQMRQLRFLNEIEAIGDIVDKNLSKLVVKKVHGRLVFAEDDWRDLQSLFVKVQENMLIAETAFQTRDVTLAAQLRRHKDWLNRYYRELADRHLTRLAAGPAEPESSAVHLDFLSNLKRINSCLSTVAYAVVSNGGPPLRAI
jgi:phosphate:Na+ symporter